jgi:hypothetical protein
LETEQAPRATPRGFSEPCPILSPGVTDQHLRCALPL